MDDEHDARRLQIVLRLKEISAVFEELAVEAVALADELQSWGDGDVIEVDAAHWHDGTLARN
jgi:hypothetical protein